MAREVPEIDRLIEAGLTLYGQGNLEGALLQWERALSIDPDNAQANSYIEYVRTNYDLLTNEHNGEKTTEGAPFGIADDEPEYQIEIQPGEIKPSMPMIGAPVSLDPLDEGWLIDQETQASPPRADSDSELAGRPSQELTYELEAEEPPETTPMPPIPLELEPPGVSFDDATREYQPRMMPPPPVRELTDPFGTFAPTPTPPPPGAAGSSDDFGPESTPGFGHPHDFQTPPGFGSQATGVKQRDDLGFVKPTGTKPPQPMTATSLGLPVRPRAPAASQPPANVPRAVEPGPPPLELELEAGAPDDDTATIQRKPLSAADLDDMELISSLPSPRPAPQVPKVDIAEPLSGAKPAAGSKPGVTTRDFPSETRAPAFSAAKTRELTPDQLMNPPPAVGAKQTQDFDAKTTERPANAYDQTRDIPNMAQAALVSAPTRDLGMREVAAAEQAALSRDGTRADVMLAFDPIDARSTEILEEVDEQAPRDEAKEDQTRRRITALFERASQWSSEGDLERAVAAVDLALSEDPNSALAQKLIHRNRETIMTVFQAYLGDLERTPQLARPLHELANAPISPRAAFLLSRIDGLISIDEILDVCGMPRLEAFRYLCQLFLRGILR